MPPQKGLAGLQDVDMVIEVRNRSLLPVTPLHAHISASVQAVSESLPLKEAIFRNLSAELSPSAILASNTSSISITKIAAATIPDGQSAASKEGQKSTSRVVGACVCFHRPLWCGAFFFSLHTLQYEGAEIQLSLFDPLS